jgi:hypothetical protein
MPRLPDLRSPALAALAEQLRYAPPATARRLAERAADLLHELDPDSTYTGAWVVHRVTGLRAEHPTAHALDPERTLSGAELRADLGALVARLSRAARLSTDLLHGWPDRWLTAAALAARWRITPRTLQRYHRLGLIPWRVRSPGARAPRSVYRLDDVHRFEQAHAAALARAAAFTRISDRGTLLRAGRRLAQRPGWSPNRAAAALARRTGHSRQGLRHALRASLPPPARASHRRRAEFIARAGAAAFGSVPVARIARRAGRSRAAVEHALRAALARRLLAALRAMPPVQHAGPHAPGHDRPAARSGAPRRPTAPPDDPLLHPGARVALGRPAPRTLADLVRQAREEGMPDARVERARATAYAALRERAAAALSPLTARSTERTARPTAAALDRARTDLRWAFRLRAELIRSQIPLLLATIRARLGADLDDLPPHSASRLLSEALAALGDAVDRFAPWSGGRLAAPAGLALNRAVARCAADDPALAPTRRARAAPAPERTPVPDWTIPPDTHPARADHDPRLREALALLADRAPEDALFLARRHGWASPAQPDAEYPRTLAELAHDLGLSAAGARRHERRALARAFAAWRASLAGSTAPSPPLRSTAPAGSPPPSGSRG